MSAHISAALLFGEKQLKLYSRWQLQQPSIPQERLYTLPNAFEYEDFIYWRDHLRAQYVPGIPGRNFMHVGDILNSTEREQSEQLRGLGWQLAETCKHPLHPVHPGVVALTQDVKDEEGGRVKMTGPVTRCPKCIIRAHLIFLAVVAEVWAKYGGPWRTYDPVADPGGEKYILGSRAYHRVKLDTINTVYEFQDWAEAERNWETQNPQYNIDIAKEYGATAALRLFWELYKYPALLLPEVAPSTPVKERKGMTRKLTFTPDTADTRNRVNAFYSRASLAHDPDSPHACKDEEGWDDTSFMYDPMYNISQCRILLMGVDPFSTHVPYRDLNAGPDRGENRHVERLQGLVTTWLDSQSQEDRAHWVQQISATSEIFLVHKEDGGQGEEFDNFYTTTTLVGTVVESYARMVGDLDEEEEEEDGVVQSVEVEDGEVPELDNESGEDDREGGGGGDEVWRDGFGTW